MERDLWSVAQSSSAMDSAAWREVSCVERVDVSCFEDVRREDRRAIRRSFRRAASRSSVTSAASVVSMLRLAGVTCSDSLLARHFALHTRYCIASNPTVSTLAIQINQFSPNPTLLPFFLSLVLVASYPSRSPSNSTISAPHPTFRVQIDHNTCTESRCTVVYI